jgi:hypothetical protein
MVRLETGFIYIKVVVVTNRQNCGKAVKPLLKTLIKKFKAVGKCLKAVGGAV